MKIDLSQVFKKLDGKSFIEKDKEVTLGKMICDALQSPYADEPTLSGDDKAHRGRLAMQLHGEAEGNISVEDVALIKKLIGKMSIPLIVAQSYEFLDPKPIVVDKEKKA